MHTWKRRTQGAQVAGEEFKARLEYMVSPAPAWATEQDNVSEKKIQRRATGVISVAELSVMEQFRSLKETV